jgi:multidrug efflux pump
MVLAYDGTYYMENAIKEITKTLARRSRSWPRRLPVHGLDPHRARAAGRDADLARRRVHRHARFGFSLNLLTILAIVLSVGLVVDDAIVMVENVERHIREGKAASRPRWSARASSSPRDLDDDHAGRGLRPDRLPGRA